MLSQAAGLLPCNGAGMMHLVNEVTQNGRLQLKFDGARIAYVCMMKREGRINELSPEDSLFLDWFLENCRKGGRKGIVAITYNT